MKCYFDTSAIVKCYIDERFSNRTRDYLRESNLVATSRVAFAEARAAFGQVHRKERLSFDEYQQVVSDFSADWSNYLAKDVTESLTQRAGRLADQHTLGGFDAIHLSTAVYFDDLLDGNIFFLAYDETLNQGAIETGFDLLNES